MTAPVASTHDLVVTYRGRTDDGSDVIHALRGVSIELFAGETVGLVGESGSGKTTLGRALLGLVKPQSGEVLVLGRPPVNGSGRRLRGRLQVVMQNPDWSLNPRLRVWRSVAEPLNVTRSVPRSGRRTVVSEMLERVGLQPSLAERRPHELSGGQRQRVAIARAMITSPSLVVFDEAVSALDASVQTNVLNLICDLQEERRFAALFISHDLAATRYVSDRIAVARFGEIVEIGPVTRFYGQAEHPYSRELLATLPSMKSR